MHYSSLKEKSDFHIHSKYSSDCNTELEVIIQKANELNLKTIAVTDHSTIKGGVEAKRLNSTDLKIIVGSEVKTDKGEVIGLGLQQEIESYKLREVCQEIKGQGGEVYIPHPFDFFRSSTALGKEMKSIIEYIDYIEIFNGRCLLNSFNKKASRFAEKHNIDKLKGSDAHCSFEIGNTKPGLKSKSEAFFGHFLTKNYKIYQKLIK